MNSFKKLKSFNKLKNLSFYSRDSSQILESLRLFHELGYGTVDGCFNTEEAVTLNGLCAWGDGDITEGWLVSNVGFTQVTLAELKEMVGEGKEVLWLNIETLEERVITDGKRYYSDIWVEVPDGATFATGDKDNFVFRKDGWYYYNQTGEWVKGDVNIQNLYTHKFVKLFWVKSDVKEDIFTLERLLGCEVAYKGVNYWVTSIYSVSKGKHLILYNGTHLAYMPDLNLLTFFTEDGDELTFDEYVSMYYGDGCVQS